MMATTSDARRRFAAACLLAVFVLAADQASKAWLLDWLPAQGGAVEILPVFNLVMAWNPGVSFGQFQHLPVWLLVAFAFGISALLLFWLRRAESRGIAIAIGLILGGAIGNAIDRLRFGAVFDFLDWHIGDWHWPAFNIADTGISLGVVLLLFESLFPRRARDR